MAEREVVEAAATHLVLGEQHVVLLHLALDAQRAVDHPDVPQDIRRELGAEPCQWAAGSTFRVEHAREDGKVQGHEAHERRLGGQDGDPVAVRSAAGQCPQVEDAVDGTRIEGVVGARDDGAADAGGTETLQLPGGALHGATRLGVGIEQVAGDQDQLDALGDRDVDGSAEGRELALALLCRSRAQIMVASAEMDIRHVQEPGQCCRTSLRYRSDGRRPSRACGPIVTPRRRPGADANTGATVGDRRRQATARPVVTMAPGARDAASRPEASRTMSRSMPAASSGRAKK